MSAFDDFFAAIAGQESGGNYGAVNGRTGALGKYQILPGNIGPWSRQYLGRSVSPFEFARSPALQDSLARAVLSSYYSQWGARGAASAWYSGSAKNAGNYRRFRSDEPSIGEYVDSVLARVKPSSPSYIDPAVAYQPGPVPAAPFVQHLGLGLATDTAMGVGELVAGQADPDGTPAPSLGSASALGAAVGGAVVGAAGGGGSDLRSQVLSAARRFLGTPYVWGGGHGGNTAGLDCSGLTGKAFKSIGLDIGGVSQEQLRRGRRVPVSQLKPGDLVGWGDGGHVALYAGNGWIIEAPRPGKSVQERRLGDGEGFGVSLDYLFS